MKHEKYYDKQCSLECIDVMKAMFGEEAVYHFCLCNAFKYLWRFKYKDGKKDLEKARWYLEYLKKEMWHNGNEDYLISEMRGRMAELLGDAEAYPIADSISEGAGV